MWRCCLGEKDLYICFRLGILSCSRVLFGKIIVFSKGRTFEWTVTVHNYRVYGLKSYIVEKVNQILITNLNRDKLLE